MKTFERSKAIGFSCEDFRLQKLTAMGDPLSRLAEGIDFEQFRALLTKEFAPETLGPGGRRPYITC